MKKIIALLIVFALFLVFINFGINAIDNHSTDSYNQGYKTGFEWGYSVGSDDAVERSESVLKTNTVRSARVLNDFSEKCTQYADTVNSSFAIMEQEDYVYDADAFNQMLDELLELRKEVDYAYNGIRREIASGETNFYSDASAISAADLIAIEEAYQLINCNIHTKIPINKQFGDDYTAYYYDGVDEVGININYPHPFVIWTYNLEYVDQGEPYSPDTGEGNKYSHFIYKLENANEPAMLLLKIYQFKQVHYEFVRIGE